MRGAWISDIKAITWPSPETVLMRRWRVAIILACLSVVALQLYQLIRSQGCSSSQLCNVDFHQFYDAALAIRHGANPYMRALMLRSTTQSAYVYPPLFALLLTPFTVLPLPAALALWDVCNVAFLAVAVYTLLRAAGARPAFFLVALFTPVGSLLGPVRSTLHWGQADLFILCCIGTAFLVRTRNRPGLAGLLLGIACVTKPTYLALIAFLLWKREFKFAAATMLAFVASFFAPFLWLGSQPLRDEVSILQFLSGQYATTLVNHAPKGVLLRLFTANPYVRPLVTAPWLVTLLWLVVVAGVLLLTIALISPRRLHSDARSLLEVGLAVLAMFLISPMAEEGHLTLLVLPLVSVYVWLGAVDWRARRVRRIGLVAGAVVLVLLAPLHSVEATLWNRTAGAHWPLGDLYMLLAAVYLYVLIALFALQLNMLGVAEGRSVRGALREAVGAGQALVGEWMRDARTAWASLEIPSGWLPRVKLGREHTEPLGR